MKLIDKIKQFKNENEPISEDRIRKFFESIDYDKAELIENDNCYHITFVDTIEIEKYPFPNEKESENIFKIMGISNLSYHMLRGNRKFTKFEFNVDKNTINTAWYK